MKFKPSQKFTFFPWYTFRIVLLKPERHAEILHAVVCQKSSQTEAFFPDQFIGIDRKHSQYLADLSLCSARVQL